MRSRVPPSLRSNCARHVTGSRLPLEMKDRCLPTSSKNNVLRHGDKLHIFSSLQQSPRCVAHIFHTVSYDQNHFCVTVCKPMGRIQQRPRRHGFHASPTPHGPRWRSREDAVCGDDRSERAQFFSQPGTRCGVVPIEALDQQSRPLFFRQIVGSVRLCERQRSVTVIDCHHLRAPPGQAHRHKTTTTTHLHHPSATAVRFG
mmetsp:Transcript_7169/g.19641  ORF Transcript_7169/g.19641 Transcript_7169/m.19641 type:complete len:201 (+) Transcript_7169:96-698(+)